MVLETALGVATKRAASVAAGSAAICEGATLGFQYKFGKKGTGGKTFVSPKGLQADRPKSCAKILGLQTEEPLPMSKQFQ